MAVEMKNSGIEWIGDIPLGWIVAPLKYLLTEEADNIKVGPFGSQLSGNDFVEDGYWVYNQRSVIDNNFDYNNTCISEEKYNLMKGFQVRENDILITTRGTIGRICRIPSNYHSGIIHPCIIKFRIDENKILYSLLELIFNHSDIIKTQLSYKSNATTIDVIYGETLKNIILPLQSISEQEKIADFLNKKCTEIDSLSSDIQSQISILEDYKKSVITEAVTKGLNPDAEMKDSGIEWIGEIPKEWGISKLKYILSSPLMYGANESGEDFNEEYPRYIRITDIDDNHRLKEEGKLSLSPVIAMQYLLAHNDILFARSGASVGKTFLYKEEYGKAAFAGYLIKAHLNEEVVHSKYIYYSTLGAGYDNWKKSIFTQATIQNIGADKYAAYYVPVPQIDEQQGIVKYLDKKCTEIDVIITKKREQLDVLEQYKKSLIYEYVTGKKRF